MSILAPYSEFQTPNNALIGDGGPWTTPASTSDLFCWTGSKTAFCSTSGCIPCTYKAASVVLSFNVKYIANVSLPLSQYGNPDSVDYTFDYNLAWASDKTAQGASLSTQVSVGDSSSVDNFSSSDSSWLWYSSPSSLGDPFHHAGTTSLLKSADGATGYIPIIISFSFTRQQGSDSQWYFIAGNFHITPKSTTGNSPSSGPGTVAAGSSSSSISSSSTTGPATQSTQGTSHTLSSVIPLGFSTQSVSASASDQQSAGVGSGSSSSSPNVGRASVQSIPIAAIVGGVLGGLSLLGLFSLFLFLLYRKKMNQLKERHQDNLTRNASAAGGEGGDDESTRRAGTSTMHSESLIGLGPSLDGSKSPNQQDGFTSAPATPFIIPSSSHQANRLDESAQLVPQQMRSRRSGPSRRGHRPQPSFSNYGTAYNTDVPPPAYSDVHGIVETSNDHGDEDDDDTYDDDTYDDDEREETILSGSSRMDAMSQPSEQGESYEMRRVRIGDGKWRPGWIESPSVANSAAVPIANLAFSPNAR